MVIGVQGLAPAKVGMTLASTRTELSLDAADHPGLKWQHGFSTRGEATR